MALLPPRMLSPLKGASLSLVPISYKRKEMESHELLFSFRKGTSIVGKRLGA